MARVFIYALAEPDSDTIRYVGKTNNPKKRLSGHLVHARRGRQTHCACWLRSLLRQDKRPALLILEETDEEYWAEAERRWIAQLKLLGCALTNHSYGGDGPTGVKRSRGVMERCNAPQRGRPVTPQALRNMIDSWTDERRDHVSRKHQGRSKGGSNYAGVSVCRTTGRWQARLSKDGKQYWGGRYDTEEEAARAYDLLAQTHFGESARTNF